MITSLKCHLLSAMAAVALLYAATPAPALAASPAFTWTGFYVGASGGLIDQNARVTDQQDWWCFCTTGRVAIGGLFGGNVGYNYQMDDIALGNAHLSNIVVGLEADISRPFVKSSGIERSESPFSTRLQAVSTVRGRIGYAFDGVLLYATPGLAIGAIDDKWIDCCGRGTANTSSVWVGWTAGGGVEYAVAQDWTVKAEALYAKFSDQTGVCSGCNTPGHYHFRYSNDYTIARLGVNYKF